MHSTSREGVLSHLMDCRRSRTAPPWQSIVTPTDDQSDMANGSGINGNDFRIHGMASGLPAKASEASGRRFGRLPPWLRLLTACLRGTPRLPLQQQRSKCCQSSKPILSGSGLKQATWLVSEGPMEDPSSPRPMAPEQCILTGTKDAHCCPGFLTT